ncbi:MAG: hemolysin family protein [Rickettsiaceae bacterium]
MPKPSDKEGPTLVKGTYKPRAPKLKEFFKRLLRRPSKAIQEAKGGSKITLASLQGESSKIISNIQDFAEATAEDVMVPRSDVVSISISATLEELCRVIIEHGHTRTLVFNERLDNIVGFIHIKDLFEVVAESKKFNLRKLIRKHIICPHSMKLIDLLAQMQVNRTHIAVVVDEYGGTDGLVTIEDIMEKIVGRIDDEHDIDTEEESFKILQPGLMVTSARVEIEEIESVIGMRLKDEEDEIDTIGGLVMAISGSVPEKGERVAINDDVVAEIIESTPRTIKQIKITYSVK